jgi:hypothetical protein
MVQFSQLPTAFRVPSDNFLALTTGASLVAISRSFIREGQQFVLTGSDFNADLQECSIAYWAVCQSSKAISGYYDRAYLSQVTHLPNEEVQKLLDERANFLLFLRVYKVPIETSQTLQFNRQFAALSSPIAVVNEFPVISDASFRLRKNQVENCTLPEHPELEAFQSTIAHYAKTYSEANTFNADLKAFLGWDNHVIRKSLTDNLSWITTINDLGNRSKEIEGEPKNNWQAGTDFENIVKRSLEFLGFGIDEAHRGGAGGLDFFCSFPYPLTGECKCGKKIPSGTTEELIKLGGMRLPSANEFLASTKIIIGPGEPSPDVITAANNWKVSIIKPMSLQKLVELHNQFPIDLIALKKYLKPGQVDNEIDTYIELHLVEIRVRAHIVSTLKKFLKDKKIKEIGFEMFCGVFFASNPPQDLSDKDLYNILIELSSPLTGYLGRTKGNTWKDDRFYFLRDLIVS